MLLENMDFVKNIVNNKEEPSLEEQVQLWQENVNDSIQINNIIFNKTKNTYPVISIDNHVYNDLEFFNTNDGKNTSVSYALKQNTITPYGKHVMNYLLKHPLKEESNIKERQWITNYFITNKKFSDKIKNFLTSITKPEQIFWLWKETDEQTQTLYDMVYFKLPIIGDFINSSEEVLAGTSIYKIFISPFFSMMTPVLCFLLPYIFWIMVY